MAPRKHVHSADRQSQPLQEEGQTDDFDFGEYNERMWITEFEAAKQGNLALLIQALRSKTPSADVLGDLADLLAAVSKITFKRPKHRPRAIGAAARLLMHFGKDGRGYPVWRADQDVRLIRAAWKGDLAAAKELQACAPDLWAKASKKNIAHDVAKAVELAAEHRGINEHKLTVYRRRSPKDKRRS